MLPPERPDIYHIVHIDRLPSILNDGFLFSDAIIHARQGAGTTIGMSHIKRRRMEELTVGEYKDLHVGDCVPFYFCPRSVMLYVISRGNNPDLRYTGGQPNILHLQTDMSAAVRWVTTQNLRWAFTTANAGTRFTSFYFSLKDLDKIDWQAVNAPKWSGGNLDPAIKDHKQAEFLVEKQFPLHLIQHIGVHNPNVFQQVGALLKGTPYSKIRVSIEHNWYY